MVLLLILLILCGNIFLKKIVYLCDDGNVREVFSGFPLPIKFMIFKNKEKKCEVECQGEFKK